MGDVVPIRPVRPVESPNLRRASLRAAVPAGSPINSGITQLLMIIGDATALASEAFDAAFEELVDNETRSAILGITQATLAVQSVCTKVVASTERSPEGEAPIDLLASVLDYAETLEAASPIIHACPYNLVVLATGFAQASYQIRLAAGELTAEGLDVDG